MDKGSSMKSIRDPEAKRKSLDMLYDYTKFHIGVYLTLTSVYIAAAGIKVNEAPLLTMNIYLVVPAVIAFVVAGFAGGVIVSSITQTVGKSSLQFLESEIGPWDVNCFRSQARNWTYVEHTSFWIGLILAMLSFVDRPTWRCLVNAFIS